MLLALFCSAGMVAMVIMVAFRRTPAARALHYQLVERPAAFLLDFKRRKLGAVVLVALFVPLFALVGPEMLAVFVLLGGDAAAIELMIVVAAMSMSGGLAAVSRLIQATTARLLRLVRHVQRPARPRASRKRLRKQRPPKDDSSPVDWVIA